MLRASLALLVSGCCCPIGGGSSITPEERARREAEEAEEQRAAVTRATQRAQVYARVHTLIDPHAAVPGADCPDEEIDAARGGGSIVTLFVPTVDYGSLPGATERTPADWTWLNNATLRPLTQMHESAATADDHTKAEAGDITHRYLAVFVAQERAMPRITREGLLRDAEWEPGHMRGGLYMVDLDAGRVICSAPFDARSSSEVDEPDASELNEDFQEQLELTAIDAIQEHTVHFYLNVEGIFL